HYTAGQAHAGHELIGRFELLAAALVADVTVILLIDALELHQLGIVGGDGAGDAIEKAEGNSAAQLVAVEFEGLVRAEPVERLRQVGAAIHGVHQYTSRW